MDNSQINFRANHIKTVKILQKQGSKYKPTTAELVEFDRKNKNDLKAIESISCNWKNSHYTSEFVSTAQRLNKYRVKGIHLYAVTTQKKNLDKLEPKKIIGAVKFSEDDDFNYINYLEVKPSYINNSWMNDFTKTPKYKHIGTSILNALKSMFHDKPISLYAVETSRKFYKNNGFVAENESNEANFMTWYNTKQSSEVLTN